VRSNDRLPQGGGGLAGDGVEFCPLNGYSGVDPEATPKYFSRSLVGKSRSLFSLSELFRDSVHWTT